MSNHERGTQNISQHNETYGRIMDVTVWSSGLIGVCVLFFSMIFAAKIAWLPALVISLITAIVAGMVLKRGGAWHATMIGLGVVALIFGFAISTIAKMG